MGGGDNHLTSGYHPPMRFWGLVLVAVVGCGTSATSAPAEEPDAATCIPSARVACACGTSGGWATCSSGGKPGGCDCTPTSTPPDPDDAGTDAPVIPEADACVPPVASSFPPGLDCSVLPTPCPGCATGAHYHCEKDGTSVQPQDRSVFGLVCSSTGVVDEYCCVPACVRRKSSDGVCGGPSDAYDCPAKDGTATVPYPAGCFFQSSDGHHVVACCTKI